MSQPAVDLLQGTLDVLVLKTLSWGPMHGYAVARWLQQVTDDVLQIEEGSLYPALHRLERQRFVKAEWTVSGNKQRVRVYTLTAAGQKRLSAERSRWEQLTQAIEGLFVPPSTEEI
jgi:transcriptional regulator